MGGEHSAHDRGRNHRSGSSPRGRGTPALHHELAARPRFIPAWAGNTTSGASVYPAPPVHPRVGGEHLAGMSKRFVGYGSSPRGRGTQALHKPLSIQFRFIPAWAGNTAPTDSRCRTGTVHPRVGGEHRQNGVTEDPENGSSPRGRGTRRYPDTINPCGRFIPAWAGNTAAAAAGTSRESVHPRVGGEHSAMAPAISPTDGSSPRGRGTQHRQRLAFTTCRFIPAWAGNTAAQYGGAGASPVHPRVGGEHEAAEFEPSEIVGSSPRGRGTRFRDRRSRHHRRFIPAWAGNTGSVMH